MLRKRPLAAVFLAFITGVFLEGLPILFGVTVLVALAVLSAFLGRAGKDRQIVFILLPVLALGGFLYARQDSGGIQGRILENRLDENAGIKENQTAAVIGEVYKREEKNGKYLIYIKNTSISAGSKERQANRIILYFNTDEHFLVGNTIRAVGKIKEWEKAGNEGQFDAASYYRAMKIDCRVEAESSRIIDDSYSRYRETLQQIRERLGRSFDRTLNESDASVLKTMILGEKSGIDSSVKELYQKSGIVHILSISGQHISIIGMAFYGLLRRAGVSFKYAGLACIFCILSYGIMTGLGISSFRAVIMFAIGMGAQMCGRTYDVITAMSFSAFLLIIENPAYLGSPGFLLSYGAVAGIIIMAPAIEKNSLNSTRWGKVIAASAGINLATAPVLAWFYYELPVYSILLNLLIVPPMSIVLISALLCGIIGTISISAASFFAAPCHYILLFCEKACRMCMALPHALHVTGRPQAWQIVLYCLLASLFVIGAYRSWGRKCLILLPVMICILIVHANTGFSVTFLDVGQGDCIYIQTPERTRFLVDGGSTSVKEVGKYRIIPFLKYNGAGKIDYLVVTHADEDHISGVKELLAESDENGIRIRCLVLPSITEKDEPYRGLEELAKEHGVKVLYIQTGAVIKAGETVIECLHPAANFSTESRNGYSTVLSLSYGEFDLLLTGDLETDGEKLIVESGRLKKLEVLKIAHHGSKNSTGKEFLERTGPEFSIISCGKDNRFGHPHKELLERLNDVGSMTLVTAECGQIRVRTDGKKVTVERYKE